VAVIGGLMIGAGGSGPTSKPAPEFALANLFPDRPGVRLSSLRGTPVVVNAWAAWCDPCKRELPAFQRVHQALGDAVTFLGVDHQDQRSKGQQRFEKVGVTYQSGFDPRGTVASRYHLKGMPTTLLVDRQGRLVWQHTGELTEKDLRAAIRDHLKVAA
jgi:thiol-disulfide isomerase/thioredoxin